MKHESAKEASSAQRIFEQHGGRTPLAKEPPSASVTTGSSSGHRGKKIILRLMVGASIIVVASWAVFTVKPSWFGVVKTRLPFMGAPKNKRSAARHPSRPVFKVVQPQRTNPLPPATPPMIAEQMQRPQTSPSGLSPAAPSTAYPVVRPQVSTPGPAGTSPSMPPSSAYPGPRTDLAVPGGDQRPPVGTSSLPPKKEDAESDDYLEIATLYAKKGKYQKAEELFEKVAKENPSSAKTRNNLGVVRLKQQKYDLAEREFKEAMRLDPAFVLPYYNLACLYSRKGVDVEALIYLKKALKRDERVKQWVKTDKDFDRLRTDVVFQELVGAPPPKKEAAPKQETVPKQEGTQKQEAIQKLEGSLKQDTQKPETTRAPSTQKKEEIPPQSGPQQQVIPLQEKMQEPDGTQGDTQDDAQMQEETQGSAAEGAPGAPGGADQ